MPPREFFLPGKLMYKDSNDVWCDVPAIAQAMGYDFASGRDATVTSAYRICGDDVHEICGTFSPPPGIRKRLSRKRIRKVLMSIGIPRNTAEASSRSMVQKLDMSFRKIEILILLIADLSREVANNS